MATLPAADLGTRTVAPPDDPARVWGDPHLLRLVVQNLVHDAMAHGSGQLSRVHVGVQPGDQQVVVAVEDDGAGILTELREAVSSPAPAARRPTGSASAWRPARRSWAATVAASGSGTACSVGRRSGSTCHGLPMVVPHCPGSTR